MPVEPKTEIDSRSMFEESADIEPCIAEAPSVINPKPPPEPSPWLRYGFAILSVVATTIVRMAIQPILGNRYSFITYYVGIALTGWYGGLAPAVFCVLLSGLSAVYFFLEPAGSMTIRLSADRLGLGVFAV